MTNYPQQLNKPANEKQLDYLRGLERRRGVSLAPPRSSDDASRRIKALLAMEVPPAEEVDHELHELRDELATGAGAVALVHDDELGGYGSTAHWK